MFISRLPSFCVLPHTAQMQWWVRAIPLFRVSMPLNPYATPFVRGSAGAAGAAVGASGVPRGGKTEPVAAPKIYCDLDGCLADFDKGCKSVMGEAPENLTKKVMWRGLARAKGFCEFEK